MELKSKTEQAYLKFKAGYTEWYKQQTDPDAKKRSWSEIRILHGISFVNSSDVSSFPLSLDEDNMAAIYEYASARKKASRKAGLKPEVKSQIVPNGDTGGACNPELKAFKSRELIAELMARGYKGRLTFTNVIDLG